MAMEDGAAPVPEPCPILRAWSKSPTVMGQVAKARRILILQHDKLNRATLGEGSGESESEVDDDEELDVADVSEPPVNPSPESAPEITVSPKPAKRCRAAKFEVAKAWLNRVAESKVAETPEEHHAAKPVAKAPENHAAEPKVAKAPENHAAEPVAKAPENHTAEHKVAKAPEENHAAKAKVAKAPENHAAKPEVAKAPENHAAHEIAKAPEENHAAKPKVAKVAKALGVAGECMTMPPTAVPGGTGTKDKGLKLIIPRALPALDRPNYDYHPFGIFCGRDSTSQGSLGCIDPNAKHRREHYVVKDDDKGKSFRCLNCGDVGGFEALQCFPCNALDAEQAKSANDATSQAASLRLAQALQAEENELVDLEAELLAEQLSLEELVLQAEEGELQRLLAQEEAELLQAKMESLETRMECVGEVLPPPGSGGSSSSSELKKLPAMSTKRSLEQQLELSEDPKAEAKRPCITHEAEHKQPQRAADVSLDNVDTLPMDINLGGLDAIDSLIKSTEEDLGTGSVLLCPGEQPLETPEGQEKEREPMMSVAAVDDEAAKSDDGVSLSLGTVHYTDDEGSDGAVAKDVL
ncbi:lss [Symbiodinium sp. CCMP2592]|nr:lss [Symbiodinium sp. CCMP2592]